MRHADYDFTNAVRPTLLNDVIQHRDEALATLQRKALLADVARVQVALDSLGTGQLLERRDALLVAQRIRDRTFFETSAQPQALSCAGDVSKLDTDLSAVNALQEIEDVSELHPIIGCAREPARVELRIHVRFGQPEIVEPQNARRAPLHESERVNVGNLVSAQTINLDQAGDGRLLLGGRRRLAGSLSRHCPGATAGRGFRQQVLAYFRVNDFRIRVAHLFEIVPPTRRYGTRVVEVLLVKALYCTRVATEQRCRGQLFLEGITHDVNDLGSR